MAFLALAGLPAYDAGNTADAGPATTDVSKHKAAKDKTAAGHVKPGSAKKRAVARPAKAEGAAAPVARKPARTPRARAATAKPAGEKTASEKSTTAKVAAPKRKGGAANTRLRAQVAARRKARANVAPPAASIVIDVNSGAVLHADNADSHRHPASLTKVMTLYLLFERMQAGTLTPDQPLSVSEHAAAQPPTKLRLKAGETITVEDAIKALVTKSANDAAVVVAEALGGSEADFARQMTAKARALGMADTFYFNASGLPHPDQATTARDQARLAIAIQDRFPDYYQYFATRNFSFRGRAMANHNKLLGQVEGVDGIKTGFTYNAGYNLTTSMRRGSRHLVAVVLGGHSAGSRDAFMRKLVETQIGNVAEVRTTARVVEVADAGADKANAGAAQPAGFALAQAAEPADLRAEGDAEAENTAPPPAGAPARPASAQAMLAAIMGEGPRKDVTARDNAKPRVIATPGETVAAAATRGITNSGAPGMPVVAGSMFATGAVGIAGTSTATDATANTGATGQPALPVATADADRRAAVAAAITPSAAADASVVAMSSAARAANPPADANAAQTASAAPGARDGGSLPPVFAAIFGVLAGVAGLQLIVVLTRRRRSV